MVYIKRGIIPAFDELYNRYSNRLLHFFYRMLSGDADKAQDFLQDISLKIINHADTFQESKKFSTWIFTIASNMCKNEYRRISNKKNMERNIIDHNRIQSTNEIEERLDLKEFYKFLNIELQNLDFNKKMVFLLRFQENLSIKEISDVLGCSEGTVKSRLFYTTKLLSKKLQTVKP